ncbi:hypothetical protein EVJ58_g7301 [Rhodofomes roseus]|uniref:Uncharacterized protein n=1 Tax=Rhodofomes roseus TaxID=34475 RepID=A0A4Y9Y5U8_9APHY|nr:hypothetical protein EVJ58_g7301 [Rhodofomes roseus]
MSKDNFALLRSCPNVMLPKCLTDYEWQDIRGEINANMEQYREARLRKERAGIIHTRLLDLRRVIYRIELGKKGFRMLNFSDIALMPEFRSLVEAPNDVERFDAIRKRMLEDMLVQRLGPQESAANPNIFDLAKMLARWLGRQGDSATANILDLAVAWFHCDRCKTYLRSPDVFAHRCQRPCYGESDREDFEDPYVYDVAKASTFHAWSTTNLRPILEKDLVALRSLILACGLNPERATAQEMDALDARVTCNEIPVPHASKTNGKLVMNWRRAVLSLHIIRDCDTVKWVRVSDADMRRILPLEQRARQATRKKSKY